MDVILILWLRHDDVDLLAHENFLVKIGLHREFGSEEREPLAVSRFRVRAGCFHDADERDGTFGRDLIENDMRSVSGDDSELGAGAWQFFDFAKQKIRHRIQLARIHEIESYFQIDAVNDELRIAAIRFPLPIHRDDVFVIIDRALRTDTADHAERFHYV